MLLKRLTEAVGPSGYEDEIRQVIYEELRSYSDDIYTDAMGNLFVHKKGKGQGPHVMVTAHMDEVSLMIVHIEENGLLKFRAIGGVDPRILVSKSVFIGSDKIFGVIGAKAIHLQSMEERKKPVPFEALSIDIGAQSRTEAEKVVSIGDVCVFTTRFREIGERRAISKSFDDRVGCAVVVEAAKKDYDVPVTFAFTVQEEIGLRGAKVAAQYLQPDLAVAIEGTICYDAMDAPDHGKATILGAGPAISIMDRSTIADRALLERLIGIAEAENIPYQYRKTAGGGNDVGAIHLAGKGVQASSISIPTRYIHAPSQMISLDDYENAIRWVQAFLSGLPGGIQ